MQCDGAEYFDLETSLGTLRGQVFSAPNGAKVVKFLGVPYAQPPVGKLRFKRLEPLKLPLGTKDDPFLALKYGPCSLQKPESIFATTSLPMSEDCIYLNIYAPLENIHDAKRRVFMNIHGGGFYFNSGSEPEYDMINFAERHNCVGVSINYRLGLLGFLSMPPLIEDNLGLKDQQVAMKWVHEHIGSFGGDATKMTIYGCSAGGASCQYHTLNRESVDLFERAIFASGFINDCWGYTKPKEHQKRVQFCLDQLKCPPNSTPEQILNFLMSLDAHEFIKVMDFQDIFHELVSKYPCPVSTFCENEDSLVALVKKPLLVGVARDEGNFIPEVVNLGIHPVTGLSPEAKKMSDFEAERCFYYPLRKLCAEIHSKVPEYPLFAYLFDYETKTRGKTAFLASTYPDWLGKCHYYDQSFFMNLFCRSSSQIPDANETDTRVNDSLADLLEKFMTQNDEIDLPLYTAKEQRISKFTAAGISVEEYNFEVN